GRDGNGDRQHVVDEQSGARQHADAWSEQLARDEISAAAGRKLLDDPAVAVADDEDGERRRQRQEHGETRVIAEGTKRLVGTVRPRRQTVGAEPHPRQERNQRELVKCMRILDVLRSAEDRAPHARTNRHLLTSTRSGGSLLVAATTRVSSPIAYGVS